MPRSPEPLLGRRYQGELLLVLLVEVQADGGPELVDHALDEHLVGQLQAAVLMRDGVVIGYVGIDLDR